MLLKTLLNHVHPVKGFVYKNDRLVEDPASPTDCRIEAMLRPRRGSRGICSGCGGRGPTYDTQPARHFAFVPLWGIPVALVYAPRRIDCKRCESVKVEWLPWSEPASKRPMTIALMVFLATWAHRLSWKQTGEVFGFSWEAIYRAVAWVVDYGLSRRDLTGIGAIGVDEVAYQKGHRYATLVYQLDAGCRRLLHISEGRTVKSLLRFFVMLRREGRRRGEDLVGQIGFVCSDMWQAYRKVIVKKLPHALHILVGLQIVGTTKYAKYAKGVG
jgi:transposase